MNDGKQLRYGQVKGGESSYEHILAAAQTIVAASGKFVARTGDGTDTVTLCDGHTHILGWCVTEAIATTLGTEKRKIIDDLTAVFRLPIDSGTYSHLMKGKTCDLDVTSDIQGVALDDTTTDLVVIVDGDVTNQEWVDVKLNPKVMHMIDTTDES